MRFVLEFKPVQTGLNQRNSFRKNCLHKVSIAVLWTLNVTNYMRIWLNLHENTFIYYFCNSIWKCKDRFVNDLIKIWQLTWKCFYDLFNSVWKLTKEWFYEHWNVTIRMRRRTVQFNLKINVRGNYENAFISYSIKFGN